MTAADPTPTLTLSIAAVERDTGLTKDTLRAWERRYGFPAPCRDAVGERAYPLDQVERLRLIKRLLDAGHRPGRVVSMEAATLRQLIDSTPAEREPPVERALDDDGVLTYLALIGLHDMVQLRQSLARDLARVGTVRFLTEVLVPLNAAVGEAWLRGQMQVFEEHAYTEAVQTLLHRTIAATPPAPAGAQPRVLLATLPGEPHGLGLLMVEAVLALEGAACVSLGVQTPVWDIVLAARAYRADIVALSFTGCTGPNATVHALTEMRAKLPPQASVWVGGGAPVLQRRRIAGVQPLGGIGRLQESLHAWRRDRARPDDRTLRTIGHS
ncbi:MAG: MerR family transcriptional regulator [Rubrivivax sp.]|nr:MerR family transcriptional regulator [Rubrivivax sp.]